MEAARVCWTGAHSLALLSLPKTDVCPTAQPSEGAQATAPPPPPPAPPPLAPPPLPTSTSIFFLLGSRHHPDPPLPSLLARKRSWLRAGKGGVARDFFPRHPPMPPHARLDTASTPSTIDSKKNGRRRSGDRDGRVCEPKGGAYAEAPPACSCCGTSPPLLSRVCRLWIVSAPRTLRREPLIPTPWSCCTAVEPSHGTYGVVHRQQIF